MLGRYLYVIAVSLLVGCSPGDTSYRVHNGSLAESQLQGKWVLVNHWAVWCKPCLDEIPLFNSLDARDDVQVIGINFDRKHGLELKEDIHKIGIQFPVMLDNRLLDRFPHAPPQVLPTTYVFAPDGRLAKTLVGPQTEATLLKAMIKP